MKRILRPYVRRLRIEGLCKALAVGLLAGLGFLLIALIVCHLVLPVPVAYPLGGAAGVFVLAALLSYALRYRPTLEETARRLDALGLQEKISTMLALQDSDDYLHRLQREDAMRLLSGYSPRQLPLRLPRRSVAAAVGLACLCGLTALLPWGMLVREQTDAINPEEQAAIVQMLDALRAQIEGSALSEEEKAALMEKIDALSQTAEVDGASILQVMAKAEQAKGELKLDASDAPDYASVLSRMMNYPVLRELSQAILSKSTTSVRIACNGLAKLLLRPTGQARIEAIMDLYNELDELLSSTTEEDTDSYLIPIIRILAGDLLTTAQMPGLSDEAIAERISGHMDTFARSICDELTADLTPPDEAEHAEDGGAHEDGADGEGNGKSGRRTDGITEDSEGAMTFGNGFAVYGGKGVTGIGASAGSMKEATEIMYEPSCGLSIPYGDMYGIYYAKMLNALLEDQSISEDVKNALELYFSGI